MDAQIIGAVGARGQSTLHHPWVIGPRFAKAL